MNSYKIEAIFYECLDDKVDAVFQEWIEENQDIYLEAVELSQQSRILYNKLQIKETLRVSYFNEVLERFSTEIKYALKVKYFRKVYEPSYKFVGSLVKKYKKELESTYQERILKKDIKELLNETAFKVLEENNFKI
jgi:hypothetical protein